MEWNIDFGETHITVISDIDAEEESLKRLIKSYNEILSYINQEPLFQTSYEPLKTRDDAPNIVRCMADASYAANVGPMASVAGAIAQDIGEHILSMGAKDVIVENGGDIFMKSASLKKIGIYSGCSPISGKICLIIHPHTTPIGVCTSSNSVGHSISLGYADSVTVTHPNTALADALATSFANSIGEKRDISYIEKYQLPTEAGLLVIKGEKLLAKGKLPPIKCL
jgi:uncharacterized protein